MSDDLFAPPTKDELEQINDKTLISDDLFAPPTKDELEVGKLEQGDSNVSKLESALRGAIQGGTLGFADEIGAGTEAAVDKILGSDLPIKELYKKHRDESRSKFKEAERSNPKSFLGGNLLGGTATMFVPGMGQLNTAKMIGIGAAQGLGGSESEDIKGLATDTAIGGVIGGIAGKLGDDIGKYGPEGIKGLYSKLPKATRDLVEKSLEKGTETGKLIAARLAAKSLGVKPSDPNFVKIGKTALEEEALPIIKGSQRTAEIMEGKSLAETEDMYNLGEVAGQRLKEVQEPIEKEYTNKLNEYEKQLSKYQKFLNQQKKKETELREHFEKQLEYQKKIVRNENPFLPEEQIESIAKDRIESQVSIGMVQGELPIPGTGQLRTQKNVSVPFEKRITKKVEIPISDQKSGNLSFPEEILNSDPYNLPLSGDLQQTGSGTMDVPFTKSIVKKANIDTPDVSSGHQTDILPDKPGELIELFQEPVLPPVTVDLPEHIIDRNNFINSTKNEINNLKTGLLSSGSDQAKVKAIARELNPIIENELPMAGDNVTELMKLRNKLDNKAKEFQPTVFDKGNDAVAIAYKNLSKLVNDRVEYLSNRASPELGTNIREMGRGISSKIRVKEAAEKQLKEDLNKSSNLGVRLTTDPGNLLLGGLGIGFHSPAAITAGVAKLGTEFVTKEPITRTINKILAKSTYKASDIAQNVYRMSDDELRGVAQKVGGALGLGLINALNSKDRSKINSILFGIVQDPQKRVKIIED